MSGETKRGSRVLLAEAPGLGEVSICACGTVTVALGSITLQMTPEALLAVVDMFESVAESPLLQVVQAREEIAKIASALVH